MNDKQLSIAVVMNRLFTLLFTFSKPLVDVVGAGYVFIGLSLITSMGTLYIYAFMKETRNKTP